MATERVILTGQILNAVQTKNMFTADVVEVGGDTSPILWEAYIDAILVQLQELVGTFVSFSTYEIQLRVALEWMSTGFFTVDFDPSSVADSIPNQMALVLIGKALGIHKIGRKFIGGLSLGAVDGNGLTVQALADAVVLLGLYLSPFTGLTGGTLTPGILDKNEQFHPFVGGIVSSFLGTMRRRKPGVGI